jgi:Mrp family chromosome partitioning ATPase
VDDETRSISSWLREIAAGWPALVVCLGLCLFLAVAATASQPTLYSAKGSVVVSPQRFLEAEGTDALPALTENVVRLSSTPAVLIPAARDYIAAAGPGEERQDRRDETTLKWMRDHLRVREVGQSSVIEIVGSASTQDEAGDLTRATVNSLTRFVTAARRDSQTDTTNDQAPPGGLIVLSAGEPEGQASPTPTRNLAVGLMAGLLLGVVAAIGLGRQRMRGHPESVATRIGVPLIATLSRRRSANRRAVSAAQRVVEVMRGTLGGPVVVLVTGTASSRQSVAFAQALARSLEESGHRSVLVDGDLNDHVMTTRMGLIDHPGVSSLVTVGSDASSLEVPLFQDGEGSVAVVPAGIDAERAAGSLDPRRLNSVLEQLEEEFEYVVLTSPPLHRTPEVLELLSASDYCLVVTDEHLSTKGIESVKLLKQGTKRPATMGLVASRGRGGWLRRLSRRD